MLRWLLLTWCFLLSPVLAQNGFPVVPVPAQNPMTPAKVTLGRILFWEEQVSSDNTTACGTCHMPEVGGGDPRAFSALNLHPGVDGVLGTADDIRGSRGVVTCDNTGAFTNDGTFFPRPFVTPRKAPSAIGAQWDLHTFWDGRAKSQFIDPVSGSVVIPTGGALESQAVGPPATSEMGCAGRSITDICARLVSQRPLRMAQAVPQDMAAAIQAHPTYPALFQWAFGDPAITPVRFAFAIASYERTLNPNQTPLDAYLAGNTSALNQHQLAGKALFEGNANCSFCHTLPLGTDHDFHNIGLRPPVEDMGRQVVTGQWSDRGKFKTPHLRNIALRAPYFHNGSASTLDDVLTFYDNGGTLTENLDPAMVPLGLTSMERMRLLMFLQQALTDPRVAQRLPPFDRPTLYSEWGQWPQHFGVASGPPTGWQPVHVTPRPAIIGMDAFGLGVACIPGGATGLLGIAASSAQPPLSAGGVNVYIPLDAGTVLVPFQASGAQGIPGAGHASLSLAIPDTPLLSGVSFYAQWLAFDAAGPMGVSLTDAVQITFQLP